MARASRVSRLFKRRTQLARSFLKDNEQAIWDVLSSWYLEQSFIEEHKLTGDTKRALTDVEDKNNIHFVFKNGKGLKGGYVWGARTTGARYNPEIFISAPSDVVVDVLLEGRDRIVRGRR